MKLYLRIFILFLFSLFISKSFSQEEEVIDSLEQLLDEVQEKQKAAILNALAKEFKYSDHEKCIEYANDALELADKYGDKEQVALALFNLGESYFENRKFEDAERYYTQALGNARETGNKKLIIDILTSYGGMLDDLGKSEGRTLLQEALELAKEINYYKGISKSLNYIGFSYYFKSQFSDAIDYFEEAYTLSQDNADTSNIEINARVLGACYYRQGNYSKAVERYIESLRLSDKMGQSSIVARNMLNIANVYKQQKYFDEAYEYLVQAKNVYMELMDSTRLAVSYNNLGNLLKEKSFHVIDTLKKANNYSEADSLRLLKEYLQAKRFIDSAIFINETLDDQVALSSNYGNRAIILYNLHRYDEAAYEYQKALNLAEKLDDKRQICIILQSAGELYYKTKNYTKALNYFNRSLKLANELELVELQQNNYKGLSDVYEVYRNYRKAFESYKLYTEKKDILFNEASQKTIRQMKAIYESDKKQQQIEKLALQDEANKATIKQQKTVSIGFGIGAIFLFGFLVFAYRQLMIIKKKNVLLNEQNIQINQQKEEIEAQRDEIQAQRDLVMKQKEEITDSIHYAQRIQKAVLPSDEYTNEILPEHMILFKPRDIVSGDYYWMTKKKNKVIAVAADCTGHGVPGAFMSMLGVSFLNEIVNKLENPEAHTILNHLRTYVKTTLDQTGKKDEAKDGMDLALTIYDFENLTLEYAGAYNPLYICRKGEEEIIEYKADKMPIGIYIKERDSFTKHVIQLKSGDTIYTFSDGFVDQFGGENGRKYMSKPFKRLLMSIQDKSMAEQKEILNRTIIEWQGDTPQIDDIIILGIRIP